MSKRIPETDIATFARNNLKGRAMAHLLKEFDRLLWGSLKLFKPTVSDFKELEINCEKFLKMVHWQFPEECKNRLMLLECAAYYLGVIGWWFDWFLSIQSEENYESLHAKSARLWNLNYCADRICKEYREMITEG